MKSWCVIAWLSSLLLGLLSAFNLPDPLVEVHKSEVFVSLPGKLEGIQSTLFRAEQLTDKCENHNYTYISHSPWKGKIKLPKNIPRDAKLRLQTLVVRENNSICIKSSVYTIDINGTGHLDAKHPTAIRPEVDFKALIEHCKPVTIRLNETVTEYADPKGRTFSSGELIFEDNFSNGQRIKDNWKHKVVSHCTGGVYQEYVAFVADPEYSYIDHNKLHIHIAKHEHIPGEIFRLKGCTPSNPDKARLECGPLKPLGNIPPLRSAKIYTESFSFKYGRVEIRARMPKGDWLFPCKVYFFIADLALQPKKKSVANNFVDQIRLYARGNAFLQDRQLNSFDGRSLFGSALVWNAETDMRHTDYWVMSPNEDSHHFSHDFHDYTIIWMPDQIVFKVDGKFFGAISNSSVLSRFNEQCNLVLGLSAGGGMNFDDDVLMKEQKVAKYSNSFPNAAKLFKEILQKMTWEKPTLVIDHVRVYAIDKDGN
ncbi:gram-negative bacteria-binding protein 2-like [Drosophila subobscura]|uniref:gram-negative bacteria-binding protein 2-like n=1 Tax=Drosophila subobscura TaxID=7241 RepID=UPI00155AC9A3|nr:gram-negative bacteria-binding protein 2-like [Drosophila subobscura]